ncbi:MULTISPECIES: hypothetical protein [Streptomyces]|uniref:Uncharacterized protein n=6 Tax=Streptomyces TaxID=1883 RepID=A0A8A1UJB1_STRR1|nr:MULTISPECIES: hypothetical protein [Streptomyces]KEF05088.1 hypothetical protein DF17_21205 [Streptomyces rimosus]QGY66947.1 hypothetical protein V519_014405 [Streptomyces rimosus R6-500]QST80037.1 hypothetical protein SRIM_007490 [Streptomyces rimosus subsp. rimosus ATCC 10970]UNZ07098.1 hypothetical protein SRIMR7_33580 [Streptomyces rimosus subsp. rimosus]UTH98551.1 hypothetical protein SRIMHP_30945 [Streptomyces rimosus subsp. rimosus]
MSTEADFADAHRLPRTLPPQAPAPPAEDPQTAVLRPVPPERPAKPAPGPMPTAAPTGSAAAPTGPAVAAAPTGPAAAAGGPSPENIPPRPTHAPATPPANNPSVLPQTATDRPAADRPATDRSAAPRDTAAFHLANSGALWNGDPKRPGTARTADEAAPDDLPPPTGRPLTGPLVPPPPATPPYTPPAPAAHHSVRRTALAAAGLVLGVGLVAGAAAGSWLAGDADGSPAAEAVFAHGRETWHSAPVDTLFPPTLNGLGTGPGGADRTWIRIAVAPDSGCAGAFDPLLTKALAPVGCNRLVRATYVDATRTSVITVGAVSTKADRTGMQDLRRRFAKEHLDTRTDLMPRPYAAKGTPAAGFGPAQRASWSIRVLDDLPVVVYGVSGFADGRKVDDPQPAAEATRTGATTAPAEAGLGHDAKAVTDRIEQTFRKQAAKGTTEPQ